MTIAKLDSEGTVTAYGYASAISTTSGVTTITNTLNTGNWTSYTGSSNKIRLYMPMLGVLGYDIGYGFDSTIIDDGDAHGWEHHFVFGMPIN